MADNETQEPTPEKETEEAKAESRAEAPAAEDKGAATPENASEAPASKEPPKEEPRDYITIAGGKIATNIDISSMRKSWPNFGIGDTIGVHYKIREGNKERIQVYTGNVISIRGEGLSKSFVVRRVSHEIGVERIFPYHSPMIERIELVRKAKVRRAKLYFLRHKSGKEGRIKEDTNFAAETKKSGKKSAKKKRKPASKKAGAGTKKTAKAS